jgi:hypothetical protein
MKYSIEKIKEAVKSKGYVYFEDVKNKNFDVNIIGVRNSATKQDVTNLFDDTITISYKEDGEWKYFEWDCTTDPGKKSVLESKNPRGVARLVEGQYRGSHEIRKHQGKYDAVCQKGILKVYRDANKNLIYDENKFQEDDNFGINIHHAGANSTFVDGWSAGCTVFKKIKDFNEFMKICYKAKEIHGNTFTYTLIESDDIK